MGEFHQYYVSLGPKDDGASDRVRAALAEVLRWSDPDGAERAGEFADAYVRDAVDGVDERGEMTFALLGDEMSYAGAFGNSETPECPSCTAEWPWHESPDYMISWYHSGVEPTLACPLCGFCGLAGDWKGDSFGILTRCGINLIDYPWIENSAPDLHHRLLDLIGPRPRYRCGKL